MSDDSIFSKMVFDARPDTVDFRDRMYEPTLVEVPTLIALEKYQKYKVPVSNQGLEGACTGFGLATVAGYLLCKRKVMPDLTPVSPRMFYEMAKRYDEWPGESYQGSSARGAMKGWHKHGVCSAALWAYDSGKADRVLSHERAADAARRPLGAYLRVNHKDLVAMHSALAEAGALFVTAWVHPGWAKVDADGWIPYNNSEGNLGGHAFAIVAYDERGFWLQNSWGQAWGKGGFGQISYDDWLANGLDVWVARLGAPVALHGAELTNVNIASGAVQAKAYSFSALRPHLIRLGEGGYLASSGTYANSEEDVAEIFREDIPRITQEWGKKRLLLYAPGGLVSEAVSIQRAAEYRAALLRAQVYPLIFLWRSDLWNMVTYVLQDAFRHRRPEGVLTSHLDFMLERLDDTLEPLARQLMGRAQWEGVKNDAYQATLDSQGGARIVLKYLSEWVVANPDGEVHLLAHGAGSIFMAPMARLLTASGRIGSSFMRGMTGYRVPVATCTLWAPAIPVADFYRTYAPLIQNGSIQRFALYTLSDPVERKDHCANIYNKSLLYLISNALEEKHGEPLLGLERCIKADANLIRLLKTERVGWVISPNSAPPDSPWASAARHHGDFDDDEPTMLSTLSRLLESREQLPEFDFRRSEASLREKRVQLDTLTD